MSFEVVKASLPMFFSGLKLTLLYSFFGIAGSIVVGLACSRFETDRFGVRRACAQYAAFDSAVFSLLRLSRHRAENEFLNLRHRRLDFSWRSIYGGRF